MTTPFKKCPECGYVLPKQLLIISKGFNFCGHCGHMRISIRKVVLSYLNLIGITKELESTKKLLSKGELISAAREALITLEQIVRKKVKEDHLRGKDLMAKAFSFEYDNIKHKFNRHPRISINRLKTLSQRNEQEGLMHLAMGLMVGARNILSHSTDPVGVSASLNIITTVSFVLDHISGRCKVSESYCRWIRLPRSKLKIIRDKLSN